MHTHFYTFFFAIQPPPFVVITLAIALGIWWQSLGLSFYVPLFIWLSIILSLLFMNDFKNYGTNFFVCATLFLIGAATYKGQHNQHQLWCEKITNKPVNLILTIQEITSRDHRYLRHITTGSISSITSPKGIQLVGSIGKKIVMYTQQKLELKIGDQIALSNIIVKKPPEGPLSSYFMKENIGGTIMASVVNFTLLKRPYFCVMRWIAQLRDSIRNRLKLKLSTQSFNFFSLLFLGNKVIAKKHLTQLRQEFKRWGISHYLARSGLHLVIFIIIWELLLKCIPVSFLLKHLFLLIITCIYLMLSWTSIPFLRSFLLFIFYKIGILANRYINPLHALAFITLFLLIINPIQLFFLDFQLSFGITFILSWISQVRNKQNTQAPPNS